MKRILLAISLTLAPCTLLLSTGCEKEVRTVDQKQTVHQSEPRMVSPGTEVLE